MTDVDATTAPSLHALTVSPAAYTEQMLMEDVQSLWNSNDKHLLRLADASPFAYYAVMTPDRELVNIVFPEDVTHGLLAPENIHVGLEVAVEEYGTGVAAEIAYYQLRDWGLISAARELAALAAGGP